MSIDTASASEGTDPVAEGDLDPEDERIAVMLAEGFTHAAIAQNVGVSTKTIQRRLRNKAFREYVFERRRERLSATTGRLIEISDAAVEALRQVLGSEDERLRLRAAEILLTLGRRHHHEEAIEWDLGTRVEVLEQILGQEAGGQ